MINGFHHSYVQAAIEGERARLAAAVEGQRNDTLFKSTAALASLGLREGEILQHLKPIAEVVGLRGKELYSTIKSGVRAGQAQPRDVPNGLKSRPALRSEVVASPDLPSRTKPDAQGRPSFFPGGDEGPRVASDEMRRHVYSCGQPVRIKIKRRSGYVNWYRVNSPDGEGWQAEKPHGYQPCPYIGAVDPFDPELAGDVLYWPEGEKDCDTLGRHGLPAFTFGGTGDGLPPGVEEHVRGRHVVILADNDIGGSAHADKKARLAYPMAASVRIVEFSDQPVGHDVSDYLQVASLAEFRRKEDSTPFWVPPKVNSPERKTGAGWRDAIITASDLKVKTFSPVRFVVPGYIPEGVTIFAGKPKIGKSWLLYDVCLASAADRYVLGHLKPAQGDVLYLALEDSERRLKSRLSKLWPDGLWPSRLSLATKWRRADMGGIEDIAAWCDTATNPTLVVIDTLEKFRPPTKPHARAYTVDYEAIAGLQALAHQRALAIVLVHHVRKLEADDPFDMVSGTNGLTGAADTLLVMKRQSGNVILYSRGRDIDDKETACRFDKGTCRWALLGDAEEIQTSGERAAVMSAVGSAGAVGLSTREIMLATERTDRNAVDQLLFKMFRDGELTRLKRGVYAIADKIGKKERSGIQITDIQPENTNLTDLTNITADAKQG